MRRVTKLPPNENMVPEHFGHDATFANNPLSPDILSAMSPESYTNPNISPDCFNDMKGMNPQAALVMLSTDRLVRPVGVHGIAPDVNISPFVNALVVNPDYKLDPSDIVDLKRDTTVNRHLIQMHVERRHQIYNHIGQANAYLYEFRTVFERGDYLQKINMMMHLPLQLTENECKTILELIMETYGSNNMTYSAIMCWPVLFTEFFSRPDDFTWYHTHTTKLKKENPNYCITPTISNRLLEKGKDIPGFADFYKDKLTTAATIVPGINPLCRWYTNPLNTKHVLTELFDLLCGLPRDKALDFLAYLLLTHESKCVLWFAKRTCMYNIESIVEHAICFASTSGFLPHNIIQDIKFKFE